MATSSYRTLVADVYDDTKLRIRLDQVGIGKIPFDVCIQFAK